MVEKKAKPKAGRKATGLGFRVDDRVRAKIQASLIIKRLEAYALGEKGPDKKPVIMNQTQVTAALGLLKKAVPDLTSIDLRGDVDVAHTFIHRLE